jgi:hypothetical protein
MEASPRIFISYAREDALAVEELSGKLKAEGFNTWVDRRDLLPGQAWGYAIEKAIEESDFFLVCLSRHSIGKRGLMQSEIRAAIQLTQSMLPGEIYLIPVRLELCEIPDPLKSFHAVDLFKSDGWTRLLQALRVGIESRRKNRPEQVLLVNSLYEIAGVAERLRGILHVSTELPKEWENAASFFNEVSLYVGQYLTLKSDYRKREALENAIHELEILQRTLRSTRGRLSSRLLNLALSWQNLLAQEHDRVLAKAKTSPEIPNPFIFGNPVAETDLNVFTGRKDIVGKIEESILGAIHAPTLLLHGARRMGKTSILNQLPRLLGANFAPAVVDCQDPAVRGSPAALLSHITIVIKNGLGRRHTRVDMLPKSALESEPYFAFDEWLHKVEKTLRQDMRVLLCLDEYESLADSLAKGWGEDFLDSLRHQFQHRKRLVIMFTGSHTFAELGPIWTSHFISVRRIHVSFLNRGDVSLLLTKPIPRFAMKYDPKAVDQIFEATNGQPFLTQAVAFELVQFLNEQFRTKAKLLDVEEAIRRALTSADSYFSNVWNDAGEEGQMVLRNIVSGESQAIPTPASKWLKEHDVLTNTGDLAVPMFRTWIKENVIVNRRL